MPLINGMKMACEPCIRGHRSTKCTHANERLMVPVKKPGRPLSACPHLHSNLCGCSSVTAAIPRKQKCHCESSETVGPPRVVQSRSVPSIIPDIPSPTKVAFRVHKPPPSSRPGSRKQSYDPNNLERMNATNVNITPYQTPATQPALSQVNNNDHSENGVTSPYMNGSQHPQLGAKIPSPLLQPRYLGISLPHDHTNEEYSAEYLASVSANFALDGSYLQLESHRESPLGDVKALGRASCCAPKAESCNAEVALEPQLYESAASEGRPRISGASLISRTTAQEALVTDGNSETAHYLFTDNFSTAQNIYSSFTPQPKVHEYPASYGSYQHPLQPSQWRKDFISNMYAQPALPPEILNGLAPFNSDTQPYQKTLHFCSCGDTCQCIGCATHPYNSATRDCVRSAYIMSNELSAFANSETNNGYTKDTSLKSTSAPRISENGEEMSPPYGDTPSDSSAGEEQTLSASDYIFVNYQFTNDGCGGDTNSCPCGDECECIGCTIHRFDESNMVLPPDSWTNEEVFTIREGVGSESGVPVKDEPKVDEFAEELRDVVDDNALL